MAIVDRPPADRIGVLYTYCPRCQGSGRVSVWTDDNQQAETWCGVCSGTGRFSSKDIMGPDHTYGLPDTPRRRFADGIASVETQGRSRS